MIHALTSLTISSTLFLPDYPHPRVLHSFPTRRSSDLKAARNASLRETPGCIFAFAGRAGMSAAATTRRTSTPPSISRRRSEEHTSELQSPDHLVCRLLLEKKKKKKKKDNIVKIKNEVK